jgi:hypothetical protein
MKDKQSLIIAKSFFYEISLIKLRKSFEIVSNNLIFSFSDAVRLNLSNNGRFNPSRNLNKSKIIFYSRLFFNSFTFPQQLKLY